MFAHRVALGVQLGPRGSQAGHNTLGLVCVSGRADERIGTVETLTLDAFVRAQRIAHVDAIKRDIEGARAPCSPGATTLLHDWRPSWNIEVSAKAIAGGGQTAPGILDPFRDARYRVFRLDVPGALFTELHSGDAIPSGNLVAVPAERPRIYYSPGVDPKNLSMRMTPQISTAVLEKFRPWSGIVPSGYFAYFLGNITRADYWAFSKEIRALYDRERFEAFSGPSMDDNIFDWLVLLEAVAEAKNSFTMAAVGAGWGRWLVAGAFAAKQFGDLPFRLIGVEAEPTHFKWMQQHFSDNGIDPADHELIEAAASGRSGHAWFYFGKPDSWYGQSLIEDQPLALAPTANEAEYHGEKARLVRTIDLTELVSNYRRIDYLHMDIQGAELDVLSSAPDILNNKVKRVLVGTHSSDIEDGLRRLFSDIGWRAQYDFPLNTQLRVNDTLVALGDGVQVWLNPAL